MLNTITIQGRLTADPQLRVAQNDLKHVSFTVACERDQGNETDFFKCKAWRWPAEFICKYFTKGSMIVVNGRLQNHTFTDKDGIKRTVAEINVYDAYFCGKKPAQEPAEFNEEDCPF